MGVNGQETGHRGMDCAEENMYQKPRPNIVVLRLVHAKALLKGRLLAWDWRGGDAICFCTVGWRRGLVCWGGRIRLRLLLHRRKGVENSVRCFMNWLLSGISCLPVGHFS